MISAEESDQAVVISFHNSVNTIPKEKLLTLIEKFYRLDEARSSCTDGAGLGLAIAKEIIALYGGTITATSVNHTVAFVITLPVTH